MAPTVAAVPESQYVALAVAVAAAATAEASRINSSVIVEQSSSSMQ